MINLKDDGIRFSAESTKWTEQVEKPLFPSFSLLNSVLPSVPIADFLGLLRVSPDPSSMRFGTPIHGTFPGLITTHFHSSVPSSEPVRSNVIRAGPYRRPPFPPGR